METLKNNIKAVTVLPLTVFDGDNTPLEGDAIDMYQTSDGPAFDTALVTAVVGAVGADVSEALLSIEEDDDEEFGDPSVAEGGTAVDVVAGDLTQTFQIRRTKRYIRAVLAVTEDGAGDTVEIAATAILCNWAKPFPLV